MTVKEAYTKFRHIENTLDLCNWRVDGVPIWDYLRFRVWRCILERSRLVEQVHRWSPRGSFFSRIVANVRSIQNIVTRNPLFADKCDFLFIGNGALRRKRGHGNKDIEIWCDPLIDYLGRDRCILLEPTNRVGLHCANNRTKRLLSTRVFDFWSLLARGFGILHVTLSDEGKDFLKELNASVHESYGIDGLLSEAFVANILWQRRNRLPLITTSIKRMRPKAIFLVCSYGKEVYVEACRALSVPVIELQHGTISPFHPGYNYPGCSKKSLFPDYFLSFGDYWNAIVDFPIARENVRSLGYPYLDRTLEALKQTKKKKIVFISQGTIGKELSQFAVKLEKLLPKKWEVIYKLHPGEVYGWNDAYPELKQSGISVLAGDEPSLHTLLGQAAIQIGVYSTAVFEGMALGCDTYLVNLFGIEYMHPLIEKGFCTLVDSPEQINISESDKKTEIDEIERIFSDHWRSNLDKAIAEWL